MNIRRSGGIFLLIALLLGGCFDSTDSAIPPDAANLWFVVVISGQLPEEEIVRIGKSVSLQRA